ncbi:MAG: Hpt domain-containing protein [Ignavibacteriota bacterium]
MNDYLAKPVELRRLAEMLTKWLKAHRGTAPTPPLQQSEPARPKLFDRESLLRRLMGDERLASAVLQSFLAECPTRLSDLRQRIAAADSPGARGLAHALKGAAATAIGGNAACARYGHGAGWGRGPIRAVQ